jgi:hypothetical protein
MSVKLILRYILVLIFWYISFKASAQKNTFFEEYGLYGKVKSYTEVSFSAIDTLGKIIEGKKSRSSMFGQEIEYTVHSVFDSNGLKIEEISFSLDRSIFEKNIFKYNQAGKNMETQMVDPNGSLISKGVYVYNKNGALTGYFNYTSTGTIADSVIFKNNSKNEMIEKAWYYGDGHLAERNSYVLDKIGQIIEKKMYNSDSTFLEKTIFIYDLKGNNIEKTLYKPDGSLDEKTKFQFDNLNNQLEEKIYDSLGRIIEKNVWIYTYDSHKNWIKRIDYKNNKPEYILKRQIEYY